MLCSNQDLLARVISLFIKEEDYMVISEKQS